MIIKQRIQKADGTIRFRSYLKQQKLGRGGFAHCFKVQRMEDKKQFALKIIDKKLLNKPKSQQKMLSEIKIHRTCKHNHVCDLQRVFEDTENVYMLLQLCSNGNMFELIKRRKILSIQQTQYYLYQLVQSLIYLHSLKIIHRDIKLGNLLIDEKMQLKLADFGLACRMEFVGDRKHTVCGTPNYIAPQIILSSLGIGHSGHSYQVDIWSVGVILYLMLVGKAPFETLRIDKTYQKISKADFNFPDYVHNKQAKDLIRKILVVDISKRYTFQEILNHPFMKPKNGIPKIIPQLSVYQAPIFKKYEKYQEKQVKNLVRCASIQSIRSQVDMSMSDFDGLPSYNGSQNTQRGSDNHVNHLLSSRQRSKESSSLLKSVFSTSSLSKSLKKLMNISVSITQPTLKPADSSCISLSNINSTSKNEVQQYKYYSYPYIIKFKKQILLSYQLNTGYIGTYEPNYKILYNKQDRLYFEIQGDNNIKKITQKQAIAHENINNRKKFLRPFLKENIECQPYLSVGRVVYIIRIIEVKTENVILFKLSNNTIQMNNYEKNVNLLINDKQLILIEVLNGIEINKIIQDRQKYIDSDNKLLIQMYLKYKKINALVNKNKK